MMQTDQRILLVGTQTERLTRLSCILEFLGEQLVFQVASGVEDQVKETRFRALIADLNEFPLEKVNPAAWRYRYRLR
jgi:sigma-54 specific flagellar transcriptional regulator A